MVREASPTRDILSRICDAQAAGYTSEEVAGRLVVFRRRVWPREQEGAEGRAHYPRVGTASADVT